MSDEIKKQIDNMSQEEMARRWRFSSSDDTLFHGETGKYFIKVFKSKGGMTPTISKKIGWDK